MVNRSPGRTATKHRTGIWKPLFRRIVYVPRRFGSYLIPVGSSSNHSMGRLGKDYSITSYKSFFRNRIFGVNTQPLSTEIQRLSNTILDALRTANGNGHLSFLHFLLHGLISVASFAGNRRLDYYRPFRMSWAKRRTSGSGSFKSRRTMNLGARPLDARAARTEGSALPARSFATVVMSL